MLGAPDLPPVFANLQPRLASVERELLVCNTLGSSTVLLLACGRVVVVVYNLALAFALGRMLRLGVGGNGGISRSFLQGLSIIVVIGLRYSHAQSWCRPCVGCPSRYSMSTVYVVLHERLSRKP
jgi:hypothetical protein